MIALKSILILEILAKLELVSNMQNYTKIGLLFLMIGILVGIISNISLFLTEGKIMALSYIGSIGGLFSFIGIILMLVGRKEYGEMHRKYVIYAIIIFILSIVIGGIFMAMIIYFAVSQGVGGDPGVLSYLLYIIPIASIMGGLSYIFLLYKLETKEGTIVLFVAFIVTIITSIILTITIIPFFEEFLNSIYSNFGEMSSTEMTSLTTEFQQKISSSGIYGVINNILLLIAIYIPYRRIASGELVPVSLETKSVESDRRCPNCSRSIPMDAQLCPYCGKRFETYL